MAIAERLSLYMQLTRLNRPIGILLLLWPTLWGVWIAGAGHPAWHILLIFVLGTVLMRCRRMRGQRLCGSRFRQARAAHPRASGNQRAHLAARGVVGGAEPLAACLCADPAAE